MKKINLKEISKIMSESEMKDVKGGIMYDRMLEPEDNEGGSGSGFTCHYCNLPKDCPNPNSQVCSAVSTRCDNRKHCW
jgi:hypothetical protein